MSTNKKQVVSVDVNYTPEIATGIGLANLLAGVGENLAYRAAFMIRDSALVGKHLRIAVSLTLAEVTPEDRWVVDTYGYHWEPEEPKS